MWLRSCANDISPGMAKEIGVARSYEVIVHYYPERAGLDDMVGYNNVSSRTSWVTGGLIMHEDQRRSLQFESAFDHLVGINRRLVDRPFQSPVIFNRGVFVIEKKDMEPFDLAAHDLSLAIVDQLVA